MPECGIKKIPHAEILSLEEILRVAKMFARLGIKKIRLTGGEPLLRKNLPLLIRELKSIDGIDKVMLTTNGVLLERLSSELIDAGLDGINLSLDTLKGETFDGLTRRNVFADVFNGLRSLLAQQSIDVKINCVPLRGINDDELLSLAMPARDHSIKVRFIELMPIGIATGSGLKGVPTSAIFSMLKAHLGELVEVRERNELQGPARYFRPKNFVGQIGFIDALEHKFCASCNRIRLTAEGFLKTCLSFDRGLDVRQLLRSNVGDEEIFKAMEQSIFRKPREHVFDVGQCSRDERQMYQIGG